MHQRGLAVRGTTARRTLANEASASNRAPWAAEHLIVGREGSALAVQGVIDGGTDVDPRRNFRRASIYERQKKGPLRKSQFS